MTEKLLSSYLKKLVILSCFCGSLPDDGFFTLTLRGARENTHRCSRDPRAVSEPPRHATLAYILFLIEFSRIIFGDIVVVGRNCVYLHLTPYFKQLNRFLLKENSKIKFF